MIDRAPALPRLSDHDRESESAIDRFETEQFALRDKVAAHLKGLSPAQRLEMLVSAGVLTKKGKLTPSYRRKRAAA